MAEATIAVDSDVESAELSAIVTLGPESAAALGVPVGTQIDYGLLAAYRRDGSEAELGPPPESVELAIRHQAYAAARVAEEEAG